MGELYRREAPVTWIEGPCRCGARVSDRDGVEFHPPSVFLEGRDEGVVLLGLLSLFLVKSEVSEEPGLNKKDCA